ncbi:MAG: hypothetical protein JWN76_488 [Chitinophagaceae bacterium]|nr:hypothetical protein [Chitinophagaceae bacterium]
MRTLFLLIIIAVLIHPEDEIKTITTKIKLHPGNGASSCQEQRISKDQLIHLLIKGFRIKQFGGIIPLP